MSPASRATFSLLFAGLLAVLAVVRLYQFADTGSPPELLAGLGFALLAFASFRDARAAWRAPAPHRDVFARYAGIAGLAMVAGAIVLRVMA